MNKVWSGAEIPGMIEPIEQDVLRALAREIIFDEGESAVEFGTFFGRSTACIASGLKENETFKRINSVLYAFDSFECDLAGGFYPHVISHAKNANFEELLVQAGDKVSFLPIFEKFLDHYISEGIVCPVRKELRDSFPTSTAIKLMHIDSPKFYDDFKFILYRFFPQLKLGAIVVFQDFFYHWSATLIAVVGVMIKKGCLFVETSAASSLICKVARSMDADQICEIDLEMSRQACVPQSVDSTILTLNEVNLDRKEIFLPRLRLAKIQWLYDGGDHTAAAEEIASFFNEGNQLNVAIINDFLELMRFGFSIRHLYSRDHP